MEQPKSMGTGSKVALIMLIVLLILGCAGFCVYWFWWRKRQSSAENAALEVQGNATTINQQKPPETVSGAAL
jgi:predicted negative regulator of RcsB-dependent stress response